MAGKQALEGALADVGLATVLAIFDLERRSGVITLNNGSAEIPRTGQVLVREGRAVSASIRARAAHGAEAGR